MEGNNSFIDTLNELQQGRNPVNTQSNNSNGLKTQQRDQGGLKRTNFGLKTVNESKDTD